MSWENVNIGLDWQSDVTDTSVFTTSTPAIYNYSALSACVDTYKSMLFEDMNGLVIEHGNYKISCSISNNILYVDFIVNGTTQVAGQISKFSAGNTRVSILCGIDEENQIGSIRFGNTNYDYANVSIAGTNVQALFMNEFAYNFIKGIMPDTVFLANGGGATHVAKRTGQLKDLSSYLSDILIVSGGGGGGMVIGDNTFSGRDAGGISGSGDNSANQSTGYAFGLGEPSD